MIKKPITIKLDDGLDARPIALLVQEASQYTSQVYIEMITKRLSKEHYGNDESETCRRRKTDGCTDGVDEGEAAQGIEAFFCKQIRISQ